MTDTTDESQLREDLGYVRAALARAESSGGNPAAVYFLWAAITFAGSALIDQAPRLVPYFWLAAGPIGAAASAYLGWRAGRARGETSARKGRAHLWHWLGLLAAILLLIPLIAARLLPGPSIPRVILLLVAFAYFTAAPHLDRRLAWIGVAVATSYLLTVFWPALPYLWTIAGAIGAASLVAAGLLAARRPTVR